MPRLAGSCSASACLTASSYPIGSNGTTERMLSSSTTTSLLIESDQVAGRVWVSTSVTRPSQRDESPGLSSGTGTITSGRFWILATRRSIVDVLQHLGSADLEDPPDRPPRSSTPTR